MSLLFIFFYMRPAIAQNEALDNFDYFAMYSDWGFSASAISYRKSIFTKNNVAQIFTDRKKGIQLGARYHYNKNNEWSFNTGIIVTYMPKTELFFTLRSEDVYTEEQRYFQDNLEGELYAQIPISAEIKKRLGHYIYFNFNAGLTLLFMDKDFKDIKYIINNQILGETKEVFSMSYTDDIELQVSARLSAGIYFIFKDFMLQTNLVYDKTFISLLNSDYQFNTLAIPEPIEGEFIFSGDYIGFSVTVFLKKKDW